jgi:AcrR family transcriptional regulator
MAIKKRAVRAEQKQERRQAIINQAWALFQTTHYDTINVIDVAKGVGLAKGTVYLYFGTKEALFLAVAGEQFSTWFDAIDAMLHTVDNSAAVTQGIVNTLTERPALTRLLGILHIILEHNIAYEDALTFKNRVYERLSHTAALLNDALGRDDGLNLLLQIYALIIGVQHLAAPAPIVQSVMDDHPHLSAFKVDFEVTFTAALQAILMQS